LGKKTHFLINTQIQNTIANVNVDMVGRIDDKYKDNPDYIYVIGSDRLSTDLHKVSEEVNKKYTQLTLDYTYNAEDDPNKYYYRSDHFLDSRCCLRCTWIIGNYALRISNKFIKFAISLLMNSITIL
jgi:hypothetical protein